MRWSEKQRPVMDTKAVSWLQMFDANDTEAEEGYEHEEKEEDEGEYAEAQENNGYATPAGSQAGDHEDHAIGEDVERIKWCTILILSCTGDDKLIRWVPCRSASVPRWCQCRHRFTIAGTRQSNIWMLTQTCVCCCR